MQNRPMMPISSRERFGLRVVKNRIVSLGLAATLLFGSVLSIESTNAATSAQVVIATPIAFTSLNPYTPETNLKINNDIKYLTSTGFNYINGSGEIVQNKSFGEYTVIPPSNGVSSYQVKYSWNKNAVWSDGVPITKEDFLFWHLITNSALSKERGLGDPGNAASAPTFNSILYGGWEDKYILKPSGWNDYEITFQYSSLPSDWEYHTPIPFPVHTLGMWSIGFTTSVSSPLYTRYANEQKSNFFLALTQDVLKKPFETTNHLKNLATVWNNYYNTDRIGASTNPLLLVGNGGYRVSEIGVERPARYVRLVRNEKFLGNVPKIEKIEFALYPDAALAELALDKGEIDILELSATSEVVARYSSKTGVNVVPGNNYFIEHFDIRVGSSSSNWISTKPLQGTSVQARELRSALLMALPRQEIVNQIIKPINRLAIVPESLLIMPTSSEYFNHIQSSNVGKYSPSTQSTNARTKEAFAIVKKYFPNATSPAPQLFGLPGSTIEVRLLYSASNARRVAIANLIKTSLSDAGFTVSLSPDVSWASKLKDPNYDAMFFSSTILPWVNSSTNTYCTSCTQNYIGLSNPIIDSATQSLSTATTISNRRIAMAQIENQVVSVEAASLPLFVSPVAYAVSKSLNNFKPTSNNPYPTVWNFWEWSASSVSPKPTPTPTPTRTPTQPMIPVLTKISTSDGILTIQMKVDSRSSKAYAFSPGLEILKSKPLEGEIRNGTAFFTIPLTDKFSGQSVTIAAYSIVNGAQSDSTVETVQIPKPSSPKPTVSKSATPKATTKKPAPVVTKSPAVMCKKPGQTDRPRIGAECIKGWKEVKG
jgi:peptide/nickel transport system substrate-binding protein